MIVFPNAKINIGLNVVEKRSDGFHNIETLFYPIALNDVLEFVESNNTVFSSSGIVIDCNPGHNLVMKAYRVMQERYNLSPLKIHLHKVIPFGAGLGGGSADAAFMLSALNSYFELGVGEDELMAIASGLGSDCTFFIKNKPCLARGKGDKLHEYPFDLSGKYLVVVKPDVHVSTPDAYSMVSPHFPEALLSELLNTPISKWKETVKNDFEAPVFEKYPQIAEMKKRLYDAGALYAAMSGSGSAVFGIFENKPDKNLFPTNLVHF